MGTRSVESEHHVSWLQDFAFDIAETADIAAGYSGNPAPAVRQDLHRLAYRSPFARVLPMRVRAYYLYKNSQRPCASGCSRLIIMRNFFLHFPEYGSYFNKMDNVKLNP